MANKGLYVEKKKERNVVNIKIILFYNNFFSDLGFQNSTNVGPPRNPVNSLASLSMQVAARPPAPNERLGNRTS